MSFMAYPNSNGGVLSNASLTTICLSVNWPRPVKDEIQKQVYLWETSINSYRATPDLMLTK